MTDAVRTARMPTGIYGLDHLLEGGIIRGNSFLVEGPPGSGKTTFAIRSVYEGALRYGEPGLIITFEEFPKQIYQEALGYGVDLAALEKKGLLRVVWTPPSRILQGFTGKNDLVDTIIQEMGVRRLVIDSITHFKRVANSEVELREVLGEILNYLKLKKINSFLIKELDRVNDETIAFEEYLVDASMRVHNMPSLTGGQNMRLVEIRKTRGQAHVSGKHPFRLSSEGIHVFPNLRPSDVRTKRFDDGPPKRVSTGVSAVDDMLEGGYWEGSLNLVGGTPGTGKSVFSYDFVNRGLQDGERCLYVSTRSSAHKVMDQARSLGKDWTEARESDQLQIVEMLPVGISIEEIKNTLFTRVREFKPARLVLDCIDDLWSIVRDDDRIRDALLLLGEMAESHGATCLVLHELGSTESGGSRSENTDLASCVIRLTMVESDGDLRNFFGIIKSEGTNHVKELREFYIDDQGFHVDRKPSGMSGILSGNASGALNEVADKVIPSLEEITKLISSLESDLPEDSAGHTNVRSARAKLAMLDVILREHFGLSDFQQFAADMLEGLDLEGIEK